MKERVALWLYPEDIKDLDIFVKLSPHKSRNDFISQAIHFYGGYIRSVENNQYLPVAIESSLQGIVNISEDRIARLLFKFSVELSMMMNILASTCDIDENTLNKLRAKCIQDVKKSTGSIDFGKVVKYQNRGN